MRFSSRLLTLIVLAGIAGTILAQVAQPPRRPQRPTRPGVRPVPPAQVVPPAAAQAPAVPAPLTAESSATNSLNFLEAATDLVLMEYAQRTKRTLIVAPNLSKPAITLRTHPDADLSDAEYLAAIEQILNLNGIALVPVGEKFLRVLPSAELRKFAPETDFALEPDGSDTNRYPETGAFVSRMIELKHIDINEAKTVIEGFTRAGAQVQTFERSNSILVTDSTDNVNRIVEIIGYIDRPIPAREEPNIIQIRHARAEDIKAKLLEIIAGAQEATQSDRSAPVERSTGSPGTVRRPLPAGVTLPRGVSRPDRPGTDSAGGDALAALVQEAERGIIRGNVQIIADERTNLLIILTRPENMLFFNRVIEVLDIETAPDIIVEVFRLEHAVAEDVASLLNSLIGNESSSTTSSARPATEGQTGERSQNLAEFVQRRQRGTTATPSADIKSKVGQLDKENIKILADERTNALVIMASMADMATIRELIKSVDIMLSQVIIETVMISLKFSDTTETGVDWVQRAMTTGDHVVHAAGGGGGMTLNVPSPMTMTDSVNAGAGFTFFGTILDYNLDFVIKAVKSDSRARIMSSPIITTLDNKEAVVESTERIYYTEGTTYYGTDSRETRNIKNEDIGIKLKVTPRINKMGYVVLSVEQEIQNSEGYEPIGSEYLPKLTSRKMGADVAVQSGETVVLGGLARNELLTSSQGVPLLSSIPILGRLFRWDTRKNERTDIVVFLTPRVMNFPAEIEEEARKRKAALDTHGVWRSDWSGSNLADPMHQEDYEAMLLRATETVKPPAHPMERDLAPLNELYDLESEKAAE